MSKNYVLPIDNKILLEIEYLYLNKAKGEGWERRKKIEELYYNFSINNIQFKGSREFETRWEIIKNLDFCGKRILDIGSNIGLIGLFLIHFNNAEKVTFVEHDKASCKIIKELSYGLGLQKKVEIINKNFNNINLKKCLGFNYDSVIMLSSFKYFHDMHKAMDYFKRFPSILFEGDKEIYEKEFEDFFSFYNFKFQKLSRIYDGSGRNRMIYIFNKQDIQKNLTNQKKPKLSYYHPRKNYLDSFRVKLRKLNSFKRLVIFIKLLKY